MTVTFQAGRNIAMKVPPHLYDTTIAFYRDVLGFEQIGGLEAFPVRFRFGGNTLWIDRVPAMSQAELWLEVTNDDTAAAARHLADAGVIRCDEIEDLGEHDGFWIANPAGIVHLVDARQVE